MYMCAQEYVHVCTWSMYMYMCAQEYVHVCTWSMYMYMCAQEYVHVCTGVCTCVHRSMYMCAQEYVHVCTGVCTCVHMEYVHVCTWSMYMCAHGVCICVHMEYVHVCTWSMYMCAHIPPLGCSHPAGIQPSLPLFWGFLMATQSCFLLGVVQSPLSLIMWLVLSPLVLPLSRSLQSRGS